MKMTTLKELLKSIRPLPWPVHGRVEEKGSLTPEQLIATRIYRRHAANVTPELIEALESISSYAATVRLDRRKNDDGTIMALQTLDWCNGLMEKVGEAHAALFRADDVRLDD